MKDSPTPTVVLKRSPPRSLSTEREESPPRMPGWLPGRRTRKRSSGCLPQRRSASEELQTKRHHVFLRRFAQLCKPVRSTNGSPRSCSPSTRSEARTGFSAGEFSAPDHVAFEPPWARRPPELLGD